MKPEETEIEVTTSEKNKKNVTIPTYRIDSCHAYKVISPSQCISVCHSDFCDNSINIQNITLAFHSNMTKDCSRSEFDAMYQKVAMKLALLATD